MRARAVLMLVLVLVACVATLLLSAALHDVPAPLPPTDAPAGDRARAAPREPEPIPRAHVVPSPPDVSAEPEGPGDDSFRLAVTSGDLERMSVSIAQGPPTEIVGTDSIDGEPPQQPQPPCTTLVGSVAAPAGVAPADVSVELAVCRAGTWSRRRAVLDEAWAFSVADVPDADIADTVQFRVQVRGSVPGTVTLPRERALSGPVLEARRDVLVGMRFVDRDGAPVEGVHVSTWYGPVDHAGARSGADGRAALRLPPGWVGWLHLSGPGLASDEVLATVGDAETRELGDVTVGPPGRVEGVLVDAEGRPIAGKPVVLEREPSGRHAGTFATDAEGRFVADGLPTGPYVLFICWWEPDGSRRGARASGVAAGTADLRLVARPLVGLHIRIVDHVHHRPVPLPRATTIVRAVDPARPAWSHYWAGSDMSWFGLELDRPGTYEVTVATPFHAPAVVSDVVVEEGRDADVEVVLRPR